MIRTFAAKLMNQFTLSIFLIACAVSPLSHAQNWQPLTGASTLQDLVSGATAEIKAWNGAFEGTW